MKITSLLTASAAALCAFATLTVAPARAASILVGGYGLSTYASGLPVDDAGSGAQITGMTINPVTSQIYYMSASVFSALRRLDPGGAVTTLGVYAGPSFYPYRATDIEYYNGSVFMADASATLIKFSSTSATSSVLTAIPFNIRSEQGITQVGGLLYVTSGFAETDNILIVNPVTGGIASPRLFAPFAASSMEYDPVHNRLIIGELPSGFPVASTAFHTIDLSTGFLNPTFATLSGNVEGNFAVDPTGTWIFARDGDVVDRIDIASGAVTPFVNSLADSTGWADSVFGHSSSGPGQSLYIADGTSILEISGFPAAAPEPSALTLMLGGTVLLALRRRR